MNTLTNACPVTIMNSFGKIHRFCASSAQVKFSDVHAGTVKINFIFTDDQTDSDVHATTTLTKEQYHAMCNALSVEPTDIDAASLALTYHIAGCGNGNLDLSITKGLRDLSNYASMAFRANVKAMWRVYFVVE